MTKVYISKENVKSLYNCPNCRVIRSVPVINISNCLPKVLVDACNNTECGCVTNIYMDSSKVARQLSIIECASKQFMESFPKTDVEGLLFIKDLIFKCSCGEEKSLSPLSIFKFNKRSEVPYISIIDYCVNNNSFHCLIADKTGLKNSEKIDELTEAFMKKSGVII